MKIFLTYLRPGSLRAFQRMLRILGLTLGSMALLGVVAGVDTALLSPLPSRDDLPGAALPSLASLKILSTIDKELYLDALDLQRENRFAEAQEALARVGNPLLKGTVLAERYKNLSYPASYEELSAWLSSYGDSPQAGDIYHLALARKPMGAASPIMPALQPRLATTVNSGRSSLLHSGNEHWTAALSAYRKGDMRTAHFHFQRLLSEDLPSQDLAAAAFWEYRALSKDGNTQDALHYASLAASQSPSFYSILARHVIGQRPPSAETEHDRLASIEPLLQKEAVRRALALKELSLDALAEDELSHLFATSGNDDRKRLITLSSLLGLPAAQMRLALAYAHDNGQTADTFYPMPRWAPLSGYRVEPALLFAIMRQESGFNPRAHNPSGASGVMQLMPATASAMARTLRVRGQRSGPAISMTLGQGYLRQLMDTSLIGDNLVLLLAAYNAGPGTVASWKNAIRSTDDALLFIESLPYSETREYIMHVMGNYWVYSELLGVEETPSAAALAEGKWPHYDGSEDQMASMLSHLGTD